MRKGRHYKITELRVVINLEDCLLSSISSRPSRSSKAFYRYISYITVVMLCHLLVFAGIGRRVGLISRVNVIAINLPRLLHLDRLGSRKTTSCLRHGCSCSRCDHSDYISGYKLFILAKSGIHLSIPRRTDIHHGSMSLWTSPKRITDW